MTDNGNSDPTPVEPAEATPFLRVVNSDATAEEIAALVAVFASLGGPAEPPKRPMPEWSAHHRKVRPSLPHGPGGWRASGLPR